MKQTNSLGEVSMFIHLASFWIFPLTPLRNHLSPPTPSHSDKHPDSPCGLLGKIVNMILCSILGITSPHARRGAVFLVLLVALAFTVYVPWKCGTTVSSTSPSKSPNFPLPETSAAGVPELF